MSLNAFLKALDCPFADTFQTNSSKDDIVALVSWLEDRKIRALDIADRDPLRVVSQRWDSVFQSYLEKLECPYAWTFDNPQNCLNWLVMHAVNMEYEDVADQCEDSEAALLDQREAGLEQVVDLTPDLNALGEVLHIPRLTGEANAAYLTRLGRHIHLYYSTAADEALQQDEQGKCAGMEKFPLGFEVSDPTVRSAATVLKLLHVDDLRTLQTDLNALIVLGQEYTANPRTNASLGQVGR